MAPTIIEHHNHKEDHNQSHDKLPAPPPAPPTPPSSTPRRRRPKPPPLSITTRGQVLPSSSSNVSSPTLLKIQESSSSESEELERLVHAPPFWKNSKKRLSKQLSMCETPRDRAWEKRRHQIIRQESLRRRRRTSSDDLNNENITDEDLHELKACIELGFGFNEEEGQRLCNTLPALDLYFAVNRQLSPSPVSTPHGDSTSSGGGNCLGGRSSSSDQSPRSEDSWKICCPGDNPQQVKTKLRHWAQAVACSVMQSSS